MANIYRSICVFFVVNGIVLGSLAQKSGSNENPLRKGLTFFVGSDSSVKIRFLALLQVQARYLELNNGSIAPDGHYKSSTFDLGMTRLCVGTHLSYKKLTFYYLLGNNGQTIVSGKSGNFYTYEGWISYALIPQYFTLGIGQSLYRGLSRASSQSSTQLLTNDILWQAAPLANKTDNIGRQFQIFAVGYLGKLEYRVSLVRPFTSVGANGAEFPVLNQAIATNKSYDFPSDRFGSEGYIAYQFKDIEDIRGSSKNFSYLGTKRVFNIGAGWAYQPKAVAYLDEARDTIRKNSLSLSIDAFYDVPFANNSALSLYSAFYKYDYGPDYLRALGTMNYFKGGSSAQGAGNGEYIVGTGNSFYIQVAYLFARRFTNENHKLQVYATFAYKNFEGLAEESYQPGAGINYYILDNNAKIGLQYQARPFYGNDSKISIYKNNILIQAQVSF